MLVLDPEMILFPEHIVVSKDSQEQRFQLNTRDSDTVMRYDYGPFSQIILSQLPGKPISFENFNKNRVVSSNGKEIPKF